MTPCPQTLQLRPLLLLLIALTAMPLFAACARKSLPSSELYRNYCARCHGPQGRGDSRHLDRYPYLDLHSSPLVRRGDRAAVRQRIAEGHGPMPGFSHRLEAPEIEKLVDFTFQLGRSARKNR